MNAQRYTDHRAEQSSYNVLPFSVARKYCFIRLDNAFRYGFDPHHRHKNKFPQRYPGWGTYFYFPVLRGRTARSRRSGTQISPVGCLRGRGRPPSPAFPIPKPFFVMNSFEFILIFDLSIDDLYGIIPVNKFISKPGASRRRKAIGTHWVSQLPARNCCFFCHQ